MICPSCKGEGKTICHINTGIDSSKHRWELVKCLRCDGAGQLNDDWVFRGEMLRQRRIQLKLSLMEAAALLGISVPRVSSMELGKSEPLHPNVLCGAE